MLLSFPSTNTILFVSDFPRVNAHYSGKTLAKKIATMHQIACIGKWIEWKSHRGPTLFLERSYERKLAGITQEELAFRAGLARTYVSLLERGVKSPSLTVFLRLCVVLQQKPDEVMAQIYQRLLDDEREGLGSLFPSELRAEQRTVSSTLSQEVPPSSPDR